MSYKYKELSDKKQDQGLMLKIKVCVHLKIIDVDSVLTRETKIN